VLSKMIMTVMAIMSFSSIALGEEVESKVFAEAKSLPAKIFSGPLSTNQCVTIGAKSSAITEPDTKKLVEWTEKLVAALRNKRSKELAGLAHPRLNVDSKKANTLIDSAFNRFGNVNDISVYRLFAFNSARHPDRILECTADGLSASTHFGYPVQFGLWLQVQGTAELGRIYVTIVPTDKDWAFAAWHVQQWTHAEKDAEHYQESATKYLKLEKRLIAYAHYDAAQKLLDGGDLLYLQKRKDLEATRDHTLAKQGSWLEKMKTLASPEIVYAGTSLVPGAVGVLIRFAQTEQTNSKIMTEKCMVVGQSFFATNETDGLNHLTCDFTNTKLNSNDTGIYGSVTVSRSDIQKRSKS